MSDHQQTLSGWGLTAATRASITTPETPEAAGLAVKGAPDRGVAPRGLGRSYGDAAQNAGGLVVSTAGMRDFKSIDLDTGLVTVQAGVSIDDLINRMLPFGWFVPVTPGTRYVSVGGAIAADIHGKNHHVAGSFGVHVRSMLLALPDGSLRTITPETDPEVFWATVGGMGLTGVVVEATIALKRVPSSMINVDTDRAQNLDALLTTLAATDHRYTYSVAWIDTLAKGNSMGRSVVTRGDFAPVDQLPPDQQATPYAYRGDARISAPPWFPPGVLNRLSVAAFNEFWYRKAPKHRVGELQSIPTFFHPLDGVKGWNIIYGKRGFVQYQYVVPYGAEDVVEASLERISSAGAPSFLAVLKRFGEQNQAPMSFPMAGWTLALDLPATTEGLPGLLDGLDDLVVSAGGRVYLAKDGRLRPELIEAMYPRIGEWRAMRDRLDPNRTLTSDLARRLSL